jgi:hypothetical protein
VPIYHESPGSYHSPTPPEFGEEDEDIDDQDELELLKLDEDDELEDELEDVHMSIAVKLFQHDVHPVPAPSESICTLPENGINDNVNVKSPNIVQRSPSASLYQARKR